MHQTEEFAELRDFSPKNTFTLLVRSAPSMAHSTCGYSPILNFNIGGNTDMEELIERAKADFDCQLDGKVLEDDYMKLACLRTPDGQTL